MGEIRISGARKLFFEGVFVTPCATFAKNSLKVCCLDAWKLAAHCSAAVDDLAADIGRKVAGEEKRDSRNLLRSAASAQRNGLDQVFPYRFRQSQGHIGKDKSRSDAIGSDSSWPHLLCDGLCQADQPGL